MSEEEIIEIIEAVTKKSEYWLTTKQFDALVGLLDLYNKQTKEIKELKEITKEYGSYIGEKMPLNSKIIIADSEYFMNGTFVSKFISKDKVKDIIKCLDHEPYTAFDAYGELLYDTEIDIKQKLEKLLEE